ncbi:HesA/MoeB/ThiF family protein [Phaeovibrio sulfidiphilus]|uniref:Molybdopterin-synthase adenylyltransferase n=1 Tax=Phaeovibrio sulfidiphilus TaxID=1220600 RepID=A0A8J6YQJ2_9PROT|nr:HesA/MoeB/ThiF family protein [Phaeovibrio sulfidiphilus]MBE1237462.1 HesA/MoeB/ThiF family protein [Phaeovibrio sulfidiphilus]
MAPSDGGTGEGDPLARYDRQLRLAGIGSEGQERLSRARVLIIGAGGLGGPAAFYLAASGVGTLGIADGDVVDVSNLQRQILHTTADIGRPKTGSALDRLKALNPGVRVNIHPAFVTPDTIFDIISEYDFVIDATDSVEAKFLVNDACVLGGRPLAHAGVVAYTGQAMVVKPRSTTCYRCVFESLPPPGVVDTALRSGVLGPLAGMLGTVQAIEAVKWITGVGQPLTDALLVIDALDMTTRKIRLQRNPACPVCGCTPTITSLEAEVYRM